MAYYSDVISNKSVCGMFIIESAVHYRSSATESVNLGSMMFPDERRQETSKSPAKDIVNSNNPREEGRSSTA